MALLEVKNLNFSFPAQDVLLEGINFRLEEGSFNLLCGDSGVGKSTLLRQFVYRLAPHGKKSGEITFDGKELLTLSPLEHVQSIGFVMQNPDDQIVSDSVWHELAFGLENLGLDQGQMRLRIAEMANFLGIQDYFHARCQDLSGGQKQLLNLASVLLMRPRLLILDEPMASLDPITCEGFMQLLLRIQRDLGITILATDHKIARLLPHVDQVLSLEDGKLQAFSSAEGYARHILAQASPMQDAIPSSTRILYEINQSIHFSYIEAKLALADFAKRPPSPSSPPSLTSPSSLTDSSALKHLKQKSNEVEELVTCRDLSFQYQLTAPWILDHLNISIPANEIVAILGANGSGKSTLLKILAGLLKPVKGKVRWADKKAKILLLPQNPQVLFAYESIQEEFMSNWKQLSQETKVQAANLLGFRPESFSVSSILATFGLEGILHRHPLDLSTGELQRVALILMLLHAPDVLLLDEASKGLDENNLRQLGNLLQSLQAKGISVLMVSHDIEFCAQYAQRAVLLFHGEVANMADVRSFFMDNHFYSTEARRISRDIIEDAILTKEVIDYVRLQKQQE